MGQYLYDKVNIWSFTLYNCKLFLLLFSHYFKLMSMPLINLRFLVSQDFICLFGHFMNSFFYFYFLLTNIKQLFILLNTLPSFLIGFREGLLVFSCFSIVVLEDIEFLFTFTDALMECFESVWKGEYFIFCLLERSLTSQVSWNVIGGWEWSFGSFCCLFFRWFGFPPEEGSKDWRYNLLSFQ